MQRRPMLLALASGSWPLAQAQAGADMAAQLKAGGGVVMLRHAQTEPGIGDPEGFRLEQCSTQRNLSSEGRAQAQKIGQWFQSRSLVPSAVRSSAWCRCKDTAEAAFGRFTVLQALGSTFDSRDRRTDDRGKLMSLLQAIPSGRFEVWVTHQVNITAFTGISTATGEAVVVDRGGKPSARSLFAG
ncbi:MAG: Phosphoglycerate mutase [Polaromonas sp.]|nr:Phosphoglycerate mutase [Polaromonas sp.]